ncbi:DUF6624 domain-containing protein [Phenylobacterium sp.]|uniref:DUF6624 domain-containing protein n=1 Tax=Phenylobacterium sp. TaxID=1871053 RepID=UPI002897B5CB|nr:DUF6624 domain-containing protein [Phenylobacterium sp.]
MRKGLVWFQACSLAALLALPLAATPAFAAPSQVAEKAAAEIDQIRANEALISELAGMGAVDREMRGRFINLRKGANEAERMELDAVWKEKYAPVDRAHAERLKVLIGSGPWFSRRQIGSIAEQAAVSIVNHSNDLAFQKLMLSKMEPLVGRDTPTGYANLFDRVAVQEGRPQRYGTQEAQCINGKNAPPVKLEDPTQLDTRRSQVGLEPMAEYLLALEKIYGPCAGTGK